MKDPVSDADCLRQVTRNAAVFYLDALDSTQAASLKASSCLNQTCRWFQHVNIWSTNLRPPERERATVGEPPFARRLSIVAPQARRWTGR
jgi:hypothetical protein